LPGDDPPVLQHLAAFADPWPGPVAVWRSRDGASYERIATVLAPAIMGETLDALPRGPTSRWDKAARVRVQLYGGALASVSDQRVLRGAGTDRAEAARAGAPARASRYRRRAHLMAHAPARHGRRDVRGARAARRNNRILRARYPVGNDRGAHARRDDPCRALRRHRRDCRFRQRAVEPLGAPLSAF